MKRFLYPQVGLVFLCMCFHSLPMYGQFANESYDYANTGKFGFSEIQFVGAGDLQFSAYEGEDVAATTGLGALFWRIWPSSDFQSGDPVKMIPGMELQLAIQINVASTVDTLRAIYNNNLLTNQRTFGSFLLSPIGSGPSTMINSLWYLKPYSYDDVTHVTKRGIKKLPIDGFELNIAGTSRVWLYNQNETIHVAVLSWRAGFFHEFMPEEDRRKKGYSIRLGVNYAGRSIQGDLGRQREIRKELLSNVERNYHGLEFVLAARFKNIQAEASLPWLHIGANNDRAVPGLSGVQFNTTISFVGGFSLDLTEGK